MINNLDTQARWVQRTKPMVPQAALVRALERLTPGPAFNPKPVRQNIPLTNAIPSQVNGVNTVNGPGNVSVVQYAAADRSSRVEKRPVDEIESDDELDRLLSKKSRPEEIIQRTAATTQNTNTGARTQNSNARAGAQTAPMVQSNASPGVTIPSVVPSRPTPKPAHAAAPKFDPVGALGRSSSNVSNMASNVSSSNVKSYSNEELYRKYINFLELKNALLTERYLMSESPSISAADKQRFLTSEFEPQYNLIEINLINLRKLLPLTTMTLSQLTETAPEVSQVQQSSFVQVEDSLGRPQQPSEDDEFEITQVNVLKGHDNRVIELPSEDGYDDYNVPQHMGSSPFKKPEVPHSVNTSGLNEPVTPQRPDRRSLRHESPDGDSEDDFGAAEMDGLRTPTQEVDDADTDLSGFVVDEEDDGESVGSVSDSQYSIEETFPIDKDELNDMMLSQSVAEEFGISYGDVRQDDVEGDKEREEEIDYEEVDEEFFNTQLNDEREVHHEVIEISDGEFDDFDDDLGLINPSIIKPMIKEEPGEKKKMSFDDFDDFDDSDDELLGMGITTSRDIIRQQERDHPGCEALIKEVYHVLNKTFGLQNFRSNQFEAIISVLQGKDVFVLMPTGGGKSLCYQLPALVKVGQKNQGVTIVISPLISLMKDQVEHLKKKNIRAEMINSKIPEAEKRQTTDLFRTGQLDLMYLSPEMINASKSIQRIIQQLYDSKMLSRIVVDEAHCISSWGHDFRPDYKDMNFFRKKYPDIPIMALTATANEKVRMDIVHLLEMSNAKILKQSFNRINLYYEIRMKGSGYVDEIRDLITTKYKDQMGIIYCHSKPSCEQISSKLNSFGLNTAFYHAGMTTEDRFKIQSDWQEEKIKVICATIAFGMGIDKPNVRFVIHSFIPRNLEGYYQETGRAGRDGLHSDCVLYYSYKDARNLQMMIQRDEEYNETTKENHLNKLRQVIQYCENKHDCRRKQVLKYFNEDFNPKDCRKQCDACKNKNKQNEKVKDYTDIAKSMIRLVQAIEGDRVTLLYCQDVFKGSNNAKIVKNGHNNLPFHGMGKALTKLELERVFFHLVCENCLTEYSIMRSGFASNYVRTGKNANSVLEGRSKVLIKVSEETAPVTNTAPFAGAGARSGFVSAKTNEPIRLPTNNFNNFVNSRNEKHIEKCYRELNLIRNKRRIELNFQNANNILSDDSMKKLAIMLPTSKADFKKFVSNNDQLEYFIYFKTKLTELSKERKALMSPQIARSSTGQASQKKSSQRKKPYSKAAAKSAYFKKRKQKAMPI